MRLLHILLITFSVVMLGTIAFCVWYFALKTDKFVYRTPPVQGPTENPRALPFTQVSVTNYTSQRTASEKGSVLYAGEEAIVSYEGENDAPVQYSYSLTGPDGPFFNIGAPIQSTSTGLTIPSEVSNTAIIRTTTEDGEHSKMSKEFRIVSPMTLAGIASTSDSTVEASSRITIVLANAPDTTKFQHLLVSTSTDETTWKDIPGFTYDKGRISFFAADDWLGTTRKFRVKHTTYNVTLITNFDTTITERATPKSSGLSNGILESTVSGDKSLGYYPREPLAVKLDSVGVESIKIYYVVEETEKILVDVEVETDFTTIHFNIPPNTTEIRVKNGNDESDTLTFKVKVQPHLYVLSLPGDYIPDVYRGTVDDVPPAWPFSYRVFINGFIQELFELVDNWSAALIHETSEIPVTIESIRFIPTKNQTGSFNMIVSISEYPFDTDSEVVSLKLTPTFPLSSSPFTTPVSTLYRDIDPFGFGVVGVSSSSVSVFIPTVNTTGSNTVILVPNVGTVNTTSGTITPTVGPGVVSVTSGGTHQFTMNENVRLAYSDNGHSYIVENQKVPLGSKLAAFYIGPSDGSIRWSLTGVVNNFTQSKTIKIGTTTNQWRNVFTLDRIIDENVTNQYAQVAVEYTSSDGKTVVVKSDVFEIVPPTVEIESSMNKALFYNESTKIQIKTTPSDAIYSLQYANVELQFPLSDGTLVQQQGTSYNQGEITWSPSVKSSHPSDTLEYSVRVQWGESFASTSSNTLEFSVIDTPLVLDSTIITLQGRGLSYDRDTETYRIPIQRGLLYIVWDTSELQNITMRWEVGDIVKEQIGVPSNGLNMPYITDVREGTLTLSAGSASVSTNVEFYNFEPMKFSKYHGIFPSPWVVGNVQNETVMDAYESWAVMCTARMDDGTVLYHNIDGLDEDYRLCEKRHMFGNHGDFSMLLDNCTPPWTQGTYSMDVSFFHNKRLIGTAKDLYVNTYAYRPRIASKWESATNKSRRGTLFVDRTAMPHI